MSRCVTISTCQRHTLPVAITGRFAGGQLVLLTMSLSTTTTLCASLHSTTEKESRSLSLDSTITSSRSLEISAPTETAAHIRAEAALSRLSHSTPAVPLGDLQRERWPCTAASFIPGVHDAQSHQAITSNAENFSSTDDFEVYEIHDGVCSIYTDLSAFRVSWHLNAFDLLR